MKVSVCLEHNSLIEAWVLGVPRCHKRLWFDVCDDPDLPNTACRQVEMQLVPADVRMVSGAQDAIEYLETLGLVHGPLPVQYFMDYFVVVIPEDYPKGPKDLDGVPFKSGDLVDLIRFRSEPLDAVSVSDPTKTAT